MESFSSLNGLLHSKSISNSDNFNFLDTMKEAIDNLIKASSGEDTSLNQSKSEKAFKGSKKETEIDKSVTSIMKSIEFIQLMTRRSRIWG